MTDANPTAANRPVEFNDRDIRLIMASFENQIDARGQELLPMVLREWAATDLRAHLANEPERIARRTKDLDVIAQYLSAAADLLERLDDRGLAGLTLAMENLTHVGASDANRCDSAPGAGRASAPWPRVRQRKLEQLRQFAAAARQASEFGRRGRGRPRNGAGYLVLLDLAAIYEWLVGREASRQVDRVYHVETGPFWKFAAAVWPVVFASDDGLSHGLRSWASAHKKYGEVSPLIANMALRHPEWRLFDD
jgi:hypothetical protein